MTRKKMMLVLAPVLALGAILILLKSPASWMSSGVDTPLCPGCNVIVILVDTLRADHLPCYGYERDTAPNICALAEEGILFEKMYSNSPSTKTSVASLFTSMLPSQHKSVHNDDILGDELVTMAEILTEHGYHAYAVNGNPVLKEKFNYGQGFATWKDNITRVMKRNPVILDSLGSHEQPFFLYLHYMDPHSPYSAPLSYYKYFNSDYHGAVTGSGPYEVDYFEDRPDELEQLRNFYDNEIRFVDHKIGELFEKLKKLGLYEDTVIIFLSDHGEMFLDHEQFEHSNGVYTELIDVPLIIRPPNHEKTIVDTAVQTVDILPTLLSMLGIEVDHKFMGRSIFPLIGSGETRPIFSEQRRMCCGRTRFAETALILGNYKLIRQLKKQKEHLLFDMHEDPLERRNLIGSAQNAAELVDKMDSLIQEYSAVYEGIEAKKTTLDDETTKQLKALGYIR
jgi:arylsulfatase A-like enzyme